MLLRLIATGITSAVTKITEIITSEITVIETIGAEIYTKFASFYDS